MKQYELSNHLGNVLSSVTDQKKPNSACLARIIRNWVTKISKRADELAKKYEKEHKNTVEFCETTACSNVDCSFNNPENIKKGYEDY